MTTDLELLAGSAPGHAIRHLWQLDPHCHFLNHGSFGATPRHVLAAQDRWRSRLERQPVRFMASELPAGLRQAASALATVLGCAGERLALVENATDGVNAVLRSFPWREGDEIVLADHAYRAVRHTVDFLARRHGLQVRLATMPFPLQHADELAAAYCVAITPSTRLVIVDHIFSPLAVVTPLPPIVQHCRAHAVALLVDGAHAPGMLPLELDALGADWNAGNCHKWLFSPKGCAFLHAAPTLAADLHPTVISNFHGLGFPAEFDWQGTRDYSGWLALPEAVDFLQAFGVQRYREHLCTQAREAAALLCRQWGVALPAPPDAFAAMVTLPCPLTGEATLAGALHWHDRLLHEHNVEVPVIPINGSLWLRISAQIYNELPDYQALADAVDSMRA